MRSIVGDDEEGVLAGPDDKNREQQGERVGPEVKTEGDRRREDGDVVQDGEARAPRRAAR